MATFSGNIIYTARFAGKTGKVYQIEIRKQDYSGTSTEIIELASTPLVYKHIDVEGSNIQGSIMVFSFMVYKADYATYDLLSQGVDFEYQFQVFDLADTFHALWTGYILPAETSRGYFDELTVHSITASDYLSQLKNFEFSYLDGNVPNGRKRAIDLITQALWKIPYGGNDMSVQSGIVEANMTGVGPGIGRCYIHPRNFTRKRNGLIVPENCYNVVDNILKAFNSRLCSPFMAVADLNPTGATDRIYIVNDDETVSPIWLGSYNDYTMFMVFFQTFTNDCRINLDAYNFLPDSEISRKLPVKSVELLQHNYDVGILIDDTIDFNHMDDTAVWTPDDLTVVTSGEKNTIEIAAATTGGLTLVDDFQLTNASGNEYIRINFAIKSLYLSSAGSTVINVKVINVTDGETRFDILPVIWSAMKYSYISPASRVFEIKHNKYYQVEITFTNVSVLGSNTLELTNFIFSKYFSIEGQNVDEVLFDYLFEAYSVEGAIPEKTIETKIGDSLKTNNKSSITFSTDDADLTSDWNRYGVTESKSIQELILQSYFNNNGGNPRILKVKVVDPGDTISLKNKIDFDGNLFKILDLERDIKAGIVSLRLIQVTETDIPITVIKKEIANTSKEDGGSSSAVGGGVTSNVALKHADASGLDLGDPHPQYLLVDDYTPGLSTGVGMTLNGYVLGGIKTLIESDETLVIPENYEYNAFSLDVEGIINNDGNINMM